MKYATYYLFEKYRTDQLQDPLQEEVESFDYLFEYFNGWVAAHINLFGSRANEFEGDEYGMDLCAKIDRRLPESPIWVYPSLEKPIRGKQASARTTGKENGSTHTFAGEKIKPNTQTSEELNSSLRK